MVSVDSGIESKWQKRWAESGAFKPDIDTRKEKYLITVPYPYTNDTLHVGHGRTYSLADMVARFHRIMGRNVLFPMAFHQSGTPILSYARRVASGDTRIIENYREHLQEYEADSDKIENILLSFREPRGIADFFSEVVIKDFSSLGFSIDWTRRFNSAEPVYQKFVTWQFLKLKELGLIKQGSYPVLFSPDDGNAVGEDDIKDGDTDKVSIEELTVVIFTGKNFDLAAASLRPETLYGTTNLWISPGAEYLRCRWKGRTIVITREACDKIREQDSGVEISGNIDINEILNAEFTVPFSGSKVKVHRSSIVNPSFGTGVVFSVPGHSIWDRIALEESGTDESPVKIIEMPDGTESVDSLISTMKITNSGDREKLEEATQSLYKSEFYSGRMNSRNGIYSGLSVREARDKMRSDLISGGLGFIMYETSRIAETRMGSRVIVSVMKDQWFIDYSSPWLKEKSHELIDRMKFYPEQYAKNMHEVIDWLRERPCARKRGLGTKLPFNEEWIIESLSDSTIYPALYTCIVPLRRIFSRLRDIPPEILDHIFLGKEITGYDECAEDIREARELFQYWYGVDIRITALPHFSNHLAFYVMNHAAIFPIDKQPKAIGISGLVTSNGAKIGKSKGNVVSLIMISRKYSADTYRLFMATSADPSSVVDWNEKDLASVKKKYDQFTTLMDSYSADSSDEESFGRTWFMASFRSRMARFVEAMEQNRIREASVSVFFEVMNDLRNAETMGVSRNSLLSAILKDWLIAVSCIIPHTAEEYWHRNGGKGLISTMRLGKYVVNPEDTRVIDSQKYIQKMMDDVREIERTTGRKYEKVEIRAAGAEHYSVAGKIMSGKMDSLTLDQKKAVGDFMKVRKNVVMHEFNEHEVLIQCKDLMEKSLGMSVSITSPPLNPSGKNPWPGRAMITLL